MLSVESRPQEAASLLGAAAAVAEDVGVSLEPLERGMHERTVEAVVHAIEDASFGAAHAAGQDLAIDDAIAVSLAGDPASRPTALQT